MSLSALRRPILCVVVAFGVGLLELAWGADSHGPERLAWGIAALLIVFFAVSWPKVWWIPALAVLEEWGTLVFWPLPAAGWEPLFHHWSTGVLGFNIYPWFFFPFLSLTGELAFRFLRRKRAHSA